MRHLSLALLVLGEFAVVGLNAPRPRHWASKISHWRSRDCWRRHAQAVSLAPVAAAAPSPGVALSFSLSLSLSHTPSPPPPAHTHTLACAHSTAAAAANATAAPAANATTNATTESYASVYEMIDSRPDLSAIKRGIVQLPEFQAYLSDPDLVATVFLPNTYVSVWGVEG